MGGEERRKSLNANFLHNGKGAYGVGFNLRVFISFLTTD